VATAHQNSTAPKVSQAMAPRKRNACSQIHSRPNQTQRRTAANVFHWGTSGWPRPVSSRLGG
jgi:hypothetical protein